MNNRKVIIQNEIAWDKRVNDGMCWTVPVTSEDIEKARNGVFGIKLTAIKKRSKGMVLTKNGGT